MNDALRIQDLGKTYRTGFRMRLVEALKGLDLKVEAGTIYGFVGPNGAGKSTTIKMLVGLAAPTRGTAHIFGRPISDPRSREAIGYLPENPAFHDFLRPLEVLRYLGRLSGLSGAALERRSEEMLELVGLGHARDLTVRKFSKGMVQRLGLAQALIHDPPLLVLDEPMSGLDPIGRKEVRDLILELRARGKTVFFSTHILNDVETICDRVGMVLRGRLVQEGALKTLLDGSIQSVELRCTALPGGALDAVRALATADAPVPDGHQFTFADLEAANAGAQRVLAAQARILSLAPARETLEQTFVRLATEDEQRAADAGSPTARRAARG
jgi:ABC-2 type transport system ATP-binding protein